MRRFSFVLAALAAAAALGGCSRHEGTKVGSDLRSAGHSLGAAAANVARSPDVKQAASEFRQAGHDAAKDLRKSAAEAKVAAKKLAADARGAAHDVTRPTNDAASNDD